MIQTDSPVTPAIELKIICWASVFDPRIVAIEPRSVFLSERPKSNTFDVTISTLEAVGNPVLKDVTSNASWLSCAVDRDVVETLYTTGYVSRKYRVACSLKDPPQGQTVASLKAATNPPAQPMTIAVETNFRTGVFARPGGLFGRVSDSGTLTWRVELRSAESKPFKITSAESEVDWLRVRLLEDGRAATVDVSEPPKEYPAKGTILFRTDSRTTPEVKVQAVVVGSSRVVTQKK